MNLLLPFGLLGLLGLGVLLLIYLLKPNYQQKVISSTFIWKRSLKYRKKSVPVSRLRNLLILLCQILILAGCAVMIADPVILGEAPVSQREDILILDSSASMLAERSGQTRFERAKTMMESRMQDAFSQGGRVTVIVAANEAYCLAERVQEEDAGSLAALVDGLTCTFGASDADGAMAYAEQVLALNPSAQVIYYTATQYENAGTEVIIEDVSEEGEWNAAILGVTAELIENYYTITVEVACYGADRSLELLAQVSCPNGTEGTLPLPAAAVYCHGDESFFVVYTITEAVYGENVTPVILTENDRLYSFEEIYFSIVADDCLAADNEFFVYGGSKPSVAVQYYTTMPNNFVNGMLLAIASQFAGEYDVTITERSASRGEDPLTQGFDLYIFEHEMPEVLPKDGVVFLIDPDTAADAGFALGERVSLRDWTGDGAALAQGAEHPIMQGVDASSLRVTEYTQVRESSLDGYEVLMYFEGNPVFFVRDEADVKIAVLSFSLHRSTLPVSVYFPVLFHNFFSYFFPQTVERHDFTVYESAALTARGTQLTLTDPSREVSAIEGGSAVVRFEEYGSYEISQMLISGNTYTEKVYVRIPYAQSNIVRSEQSLAQPVRAEVREATVDELLIYFAAAALALLIAEWLLQWRKGI